MRYKLTLRWLGTHYCGWQVQPNAPTICGAVQDAVERLFGERGELTGCSRTDSGVHAVGFVAALKCEGCRIPPEALPEIRCSDDLFGTTTLGGLLTKDVPIRAVMGDSHAALYGAGCGREGMAKATYGTGSSVMLFTGRQPVASRHGLAATVAWGRNGQTYYGLEGNINYACLLYTSPSPRDS